MRLFGDYEGKGLSHLEVLYQEGERDLAIRFMELLGCTVIDTPQVNETGTTYMIVHPEPADDDPINNVFYLSQIRAQQRDLEAVLSNRMGEDAELTQVLDAYRHKARTTPHGVPHFGIRFPSFESIEPVLARLENIQDPALKDRVSVRVVRPGGEHALTDNLVQAFVYTDVVANGLFCFGQLIELQAQKEAQVMAAG
jgi:hypothetical protein